MAGHEVEHTSLNDIFLHFTHHGKSECHCELCIPYQGWALYNCLKHSPLKSKHIEVPVDHIVNGSVILHLSGVVQVRELFKSKAHQEAIYFFKCDASEKVQGK